MERDAVRDLGEYLGAMSIEWARFGAVAANRCRREVRLTGDVDLLLADHGGDLSALERSLAEAGWTTRRATPDGSVLRLRHPRFGAGGLVLAETEYQRVALGRARAEVDTTGGVVRYLAPEDVIIQSLIAARPRDLDVVELWHRLRGEARTR